MVVVSEQEMQTDETVSELELPELEITPSEQKEAEDVLKTFTGSDISLGSDKQINDIIANLSKMEDLETLTDLSAQEIVAITRLLWYSIQYNAKSGLLLAKKLLQTKVSKGRGGRTELVQTLIGALRFKLEEAQQKKVEL